MVDESNLQFLYENHENFSAFPTHGIVPGLMAIMSSGKITEAIPGKTFDLSQVVLCKMILCTLRININNN